MAETARMTDLFSGVCINPLHGPTMGIIITASEDVFNNNLGVARMTDIVQAFCGDIGFIITASSTVFVNGLQVAREGDMVGGAIQGIIITGSSDTDVGG